MKIICIGRNYRDHVKELNHKLPEEPVFFMKPDSSLLNNNKPFFVPDFSNDLQYETEIVLKINRLGKHIEPRFAHRYFQEVTVGIDFTARDLQRDCIREGNPWEVSKSFDQSAAIGKFIDLGSLPDPANIHFELSINGKTVQKGNTVQMIFPFEKLISYVSTFVTIKTGDLIYTGTPAGVGKVYIGDHLVASVEGQVLLDFYIK